MAISAIAGACVGCTGLPLPEDTASPQPLSFDLVPDPEYSIDMATCLTRSGWNASVGEGNSVRTPDVPAEQRQQYSDDVRACREEFGHDGDQDVNYSETELRELYPHLLIARQCLVGAGHAPSEAPSEERYLADYQEFGEVWTPYEEFYGSTGDQALRELFEDCPWD